MVGPDYDQDRYMDLDPVYEVDERGVVEVLDVRRYGAPVATCGVCGRSWDDNVSTGWTPAPSGRCPFEYEHDAEV